MYNVLSIYVSYLELKVTLKKQIYHNGCYYNTGVYIYRLHLGSTCIEKFIIDNINKYDYIIVDFLINNNMFLLSDKLSDKWLFYFNLLGYKLVINNHELLINNDKFYKFLLNNINDKIFKDMQLLEILLKDDIDICDKYKDETKLMFKDEKKMDEFINKLF